MPRHVSQALREGTGRSGPRLRRAMGAGERDPPPRAALCHSRGKQEADESALALTGPWREAPLGVRTPALALLDCSTTQSCACDGQSARALSVLKPRVAPAAAEPVPPCAPPSRRQPHAHRTPAPAVHTRLPILRLPGVDRVAVPGLREAMAQPMLAAIGPDLRKWPADQHCSAWLGLAPQTDRSGGQGLWSRTMTQRYRAAPACRLAAQSVLRADGALGVCSRRVPGRLGPAQALVAAAHNMARTVSHLRKDRVSSPDLGAAEYHHRFRARAARLAEDSRQARLYARAR